MSACESINRKYAESVCTVCEFAAASFSQMQMKASVQR